MEKFEPIKKELSNDKVIFSIRLQEDKLKTLEDISAKLDISKNELINQCIDYALNNINFDNKNNEK